MPHTTSGGILTHLQRLLLSLDPLDLVRFGGSVLGEQLLDLLLLHLGDAVEVDDLGGRQDAVLLGHLGGQEPEQEGRIKYESKRERESNNGTTSGQLGSNNKTRKHIESIKR